MEFNKNENIEATGCNGLWFSVSFNYIIHYKKILTMMNYEHSAILRKVLSPFWASVKLLRK